MDKETTAIPRLQFLDAVRGIAASWVVLYHMTQMPTPRLATPFWAKYAEYGHAGVMLFFVASAFSLCYTSRFHQEGWTAFYLRRFFRIAPLFYAMLIFILVRDRVTQGIVRSPGEIADNALFSFNILPSHQWGLVPAGWTIGVEMIFYALFPLLFRLTGNIWRAVALWLGAIILARVFGQFIELVVADPSTYMLLSFFHHFPTLAFGIVAFRAGAFLRGHRLEPDIGLALIFLALILYFSLLDLRTAFFATYDWQGIIFGVFIVGLSARPTALFVNAVTVFLGKLSYSLYLLHSPLILALAPLYQRIYDWPVSVSLKFSVCAALTLAALVPLAYLTYRFIEQPAIRLGRRVIQRVSGTRSESAVQAG